MIDPRCEFDVPKFNDIKCAADEIKEEIESEYFNWFQTPHDFKISKRWQPYKI